MEVIYNILEAIFPFQWMEYDFMKNAFLAILLITPIFGILGTIVVNNQMAFFSDALGHSAVTGIAIGVLLGIQNSTISMIGFAIVFALLLNQIKRKDLSSADTIISVFSSFGLAVGLAILSMGGNFARYGSLLIGDLLSISKTELLWLCIVSIIVVVFWYFCFNSLHGMSISSSLARTKGVRIKLVDNIFVVVIAIVVTLCIKWVGLLIINALLILPAAASRNIAKNVRSYHLFSVLFSVISGVVGLVLSFYLDIATGPLIVILTSTLFFVTFFIRKCKS